MTYYLIHNLDVFLLNFIWKRNFSFVRAEFLTLKLTLLSSNCFISGVSITSRHLVFCVDKPTDLHNITSVKLGLNRLNVLITDDKLNSFEQHHD